MNKEQFFTSIQGKTVTFCGIGRSHMPLIRLFQEKGALVSARDKRSLEELGDNGKALQERGVQLILGENYLEDLRAASNWGRWYFIPGVRKMMSSRKSSR